MKRSVLLLISFWGPTLVRFAYGILLRQFAVFSAGSFDRLGVSWILIKSVYYGLFGLLICELSFLCLRRSVVSIPLGILAVAMLIIDSNADAFNRTMLDKGISSFGYYISQVIPYTPKDEQIPLDFQPAILPKTKASAETDFGIVVIESGNGLMRQISWDGATRQLELTPITSRDLHYFIFPEKQRGEWWPGYWWKDHHGIRRCFYTEGIREFRSRDEALAWINSISKQGQQISIAKDGLIIYGSKTADIEALTISVWQILVEGRKPLDLIQTGHAVTISRSHKQI